jgi:hypothetical protein
MLCSLRYPGRPLQAREQPAAALVAFVADQIDVLPDTINEYLGSEQNRRRHAVEVQDQLGLRSFGTRAATELTSWLLPHAIENDQLAHLAERVLEECRRRQVSFRGLKGWNGFVLKPAIGRGGKSNTG